MLDLHAFSSLLAARVQPVVFYETVEDCGQVWSQLLWQHVVENIRGEAPPDDGGGARHSLLVH